MVKLESMKSLRALDVSKSQVSEDGRGKLAAALPECRISWDGPEIEPKKK